jgi:DNA-binding SARP family transcriptional activator
VLGDGTVPEPAAAVAAHARRFLDGRGPGDAALVLVRHRHEATTLVWRGRPGDAAHRARLAEQADAFGARLGGRGRAAVTPDGDVAWRLTGLRLATLLPAPDPGADGAEEPEGSGAAPGPDASPLLPLGRAPDGAAVSAPWGALGHVLVAGLPGGGPEAVLTSLVVALAAQRRPGALRLWGIGDGRSLPWAPAGLPHLVGLVDPGDAEGAAALLADLRAETERRASAAPAGDPDGGAPRPELVLVVGELADLPDDGTTLEVLGTLGPVAGVRLLGATTRLPAVADGVLAQFPTRIALQAMDDGEGVRLLGAPEAADLGAGEVLVRLDGRAAERLQGFRVAPERLTELGRLMRLAAGADGTEVAHGPAADPPGTGADVPGPPGALGAPGVEGADPDGSVPAPPAGHDAGLGGGADGSDASGPPGRGPQDATAGPATPDGGPTVAPAGAVNGHAPAAVTADIAGVADAPGGPAGQGDAAAGETVAEPVLRVTCLGAFSVRGGGRELVPTGEDGASYRAWEVLAYLAAYPGGVVPRERLRAAVWPDGAAETTSRLRSAMTRLRGLLGRQVPGLGADAVRSDRDGTCRLDPGTVWCDGQEFWALCEAAPGLPPDAAADVLERAVGLYGGDLLASRAARDYEWLDEPGPGGVSLRQQYREAFYRALQRLAGLRHEAGRPELAVPVYRRLLKAEPILEDVVRELYRCYRDLGDLGALVREDRHLRQALREALADPDDPAEDPGLYAPEPETVALFRAIRAELEARAVGVPPVLVEARGGDGDGGA